MLNQKSASEKKPETEMKILDPSSSRISNSIKPITAQAQDALQEADLTKLKRLINTVNQEIDKLKTAESLSGFNDCIEELEDPLLQTTIDSISNLEWWQDWTFITQWILNRVSYYKNNKDIIGRAIKIYEELHSTLLDIKNTSKNAGKYKLYYSLLQRISEIIENSPQATRKSTTTLDKQFRPIVREQSRQMVDLLEVLAIQSRHYDHRLDNQDERIEDQGQILQELREEIRLLRSERSRLSASKAASSFNTSTSSDTKTGTEANSSTTVEEDGLASTENDMEPTEENELVYSESSATANEDFTYISSNPTSDGEEERYATLTQHDNLGPRRR